MKQHRSEVSFATLSSLDAPVSFWRGIPFGLQHVLAMFVANLAPIFLVAAAGHMSATDSARIIQSGLLVAGLGTCLQLYGIWRIGSRLPMVTGISFTYVAAAIAIVGQQGYGAVVGAVLVGGLLEVALGLTAQYWARFVPPVVSAVVVTSIGVLAAFRGRRKLRRRIRRAGFRQLAESHARHGLVGRLPCVPTAHERRGQAAFRAVRSGGGLPAGTVLRQSGFHRIRASAGGEPAHVHAVQAGIRLGCHHLDRFALRRLVRRSAGRYRGADQGRPRPYPPPRGRRLAPSPATA